MEHIVIVDDRPDNRYMLESLLKGEEYKISAAENGAEALKLARNSPPDLIISDILMPVMDGFTLCKEWRNDETLKNIPFIFYTAAYTKPEDIRFALRLGADRFLVKPLEPAEFLTAIVEVLKEFKSGKIKSKPATVKTETEDLREYNAILFRKLEDKLYKSELSDRKLKKYALDLERNIQKLEQSEENLRQAHDYLDNLINYANAPIVVWNSMFTIIRFNRAFEHLTGYYASDVVGKQLDILFPETSKKESLAQIKKTLGGTNWESVEIPILTKEKEIRTILWNSASIFSTDGKVLISTMAQGQDITERKHAEDALKVSEIKLKESNDTKDKFFSIIAHDLKNPFNGILGISDLLAQDADKLEAAAIREYSGLIHKAAFQASRLLDNLLSWARVQQGQIPFNPVTAALKEIVKDEIALLTQNAKSKMITVTDNIPAKLKVTADGEMLGEVIRNLVSNAIKFTPDNGKIELNAVRQEGNIMISVRDNGKGMNYESLEKLFKAGFNFTTLGTVREDGTGLGLILCKEFVEKHGGKIWAESEEGKGSIFYFTLPQKIELSVKKPSQNVRIMKPAAKQERNLKILIAEDDALTTLLLTRTVESYSDSVITVTNGVDAVETCHNNPDIDVVLMDIKMPRMDGYEATKRIRMFNKDMIIIAQTAYSLSYDRQNALDAGCTDYISKPYNRAILIELMKKCLERQKSHI
jgi:PAS domain S-box-containing protein